MQHLHTSLTLFHLETKVSESHHRNLNCGLLRKGKHTQVQALLEERLQSSSLLLRDKSPRWDIKEVAAEILEGGAWCVHS